MAQFRRTGNYTPNVEKEYAPGISRIAKADKILNIGEYGLMLDSGAYTAWTQGITIDVNRYIEALKYYSHAINYIVNLDVIPGSYKKGKASLMEIEEACKIGWNNYETLLKHFDISKVLPVFHQGDDIKWLNRMIEFGSPYIGLSPRVGLSNREKIIWLDECMFRLLDKNGQPKARFHGFGISSFPIMDRYKWFSIDSSDYIIRTAIGGIYVPPWRNGKWDYSVKPLCFTISQWTNIGQAQPNLIGSVRRAGTGKSFELLERYANEFGMPFGRSVIRREIKDDGKLHRIERIEEDGIITNPLIRGGLVGSYFIEWGREHKKIMFMPYEHICQSPVFKMKEESKPWWGALHSYAKMIRKGDKQDSDSFIRRMGLYCKNKKEVKQ